LDNQGEKMTKEKEVEEVVEKGEMQEGIEGMAEALNDEIKTNEVEEVEKEVVEDKKEVVEEKE